MYVRGQHEDYDRWRQHGNSGWGFDDVLPYFKKAENQQRGGDDFHGVGGPLPVSDLLHADPLSAAFIAAAAARARRWPIFVPPRPGGTCTSKRRRWRSASCLTDAALSASSTAGPGS